jgi:hypothetical protein
MELAVIDSRGKGRQMENTGRTEPAAVPQQASAAPPEQTGWESYIDINCEVATVLRSKRWERRQEPFQGFDSPPGKF